MGKYIKKKVFIYVGHSNWGKSMALKSLTNNNSHVSIITISNHLIKVRKMSNDDIGIRLYNYISQLHQLNYNNFIISFCPDFSDGINAPSVKQKICMKIVKELQKSNNLFFFVQMEKYNDATRQILNYEVQQMHHYGIVEIMDSQHESHVRASKFKNFIEANINT